MMQGIRSTWLTWCSVLVVIVVKLSMPANAGADENLDFDRDIAPILAQRCMSCHSGDETKGGLDLSTHETAMQGGDSGEVIAAGDLDASQLWQQIDSNAMPPKKPLPESERQLLANWIRSGAKWGTERIDPFRFTTDQRAGFDWWSLQPIREVQPPTVSDSRWTRNGIDAFVRHRLEREGLPSSPEADRRTLIRRLSFDLTGLPPTPEQNDAYLNDESEQAYLNLVNRLLDSPHYGERWARHWLDVVRFGESNGFEYDEPRNESWHYRNWVIDAFNQDMPYDDFVRMQLAGDAFRPNDPQAIAATGYLVAGPHNSTLPANDKMRMAMAQDEMEDLVGNVGQAFLGLTTNCARCHDHKFDPISIKEYYQLASALAGITHGVREVNLPMPAPQQTRLDSIAKRLTMIQGSMASIEQPIRERIIAERASGKQQMPEPPTAMATWEFDADLRDSHGGLHGTLHGGARLQDGFLVLDGKEAYVSTPPIASDVREKTLEAWVQLDKLDQAGGGVVSLQTNDGGIFDAIVFGEREPRRWMAGSNGFVRTMPFQATDENEAVDRPVHIAFVYSLDGTITGYRNGVLYGQAYRPGEIQAYEKGKSHVVFGLRHAPVGGNRMLNGKIQRAQFYDRALSREEVAASAGVVDLNYVTLAHILDSANENQRQRHNELAKEKSQLESERDQIMAEYAASKKMYTCVSSQPGPMHVLRRGDVGSPGEAVVPNGLSALSNLDANFQLPATATDAERRMKLAEWVTSPKNPLFARVLVNRIWHYHFGHGIVATPSDFGFNGGQPSHPELLDWLATQFIHSGYSIKELHRLIVTSETYRQSSAMIPDAAAKDADNRMLWRKSPVRIEAEAIRDAVLVVTNQLDPTVGGIGYRDMRHFFFKGSNFYESLDESNFTNHRRTIYRFIPRGGRNPFLDTFDCPDPSATTPIRANTTTPLQALALLNNALIFKLADDFAAFVSQQHQGDPTKKIETIYLRAFGRPPEEYEVARAKKFIDQQGLAAFCRAILNANEFLFIR